MTRHLLHERGSGIPVLLVPGYIQNHEAFLLSAEGIVDHLVASGHHVHVVELIGTPTTDLKDYVDIVAELALETGAEIAIGHSMGGIIVGALPAFARQHLRAHIIIGSPTYSRVPRPINRVVVRALRGLATLGVPFPGAMLGRGLAAIKGISDSPLAAHPLRIWRAGSIDSDRLTVALTTSFRDDSLAVAADLLDLHTTKMACAGRLAFKSALQNLRGPLLVIAGDDDGLAAVGSVRAIYEAAASTDKEFIVMGQERNGISFGHIDLLVGDHAADVAQAIDTFLQNHVDS